MLLWNFGEHLSYCGFIGNIDAEMLIFDRFERCRLPTATDDIETLRAVVLDKAFADPFPGAGDQNNAIVLANLIPP